MEGTATQDLVQQGLAQYNAKAAYADVIATFEKALTGNRNMQSTAQTCLSWLHTLGGDPQRGIKHAKEALRLDRSNVQAHFNLVLAMLASHTKGVRAEFEKAMSHCTHEALHEAEDNLHDALERHPDLAAAKKLLGWLAHDH